MVCISCGVWLAVQAIFGLAHVVDAHAPLVEALAGAAVAWFTYVLVRVGQRADQHFRVTERAYIKMSHVTPPEGQGGFRVSGPSSGQARPSASLEGLNKLKLILTLLGN